MCRGLGLGTAAGWPTESRLEQSPNLLPLAVPMLVSQETINLFLA